MKKVLCIFASCLLLACSSDEENGGKIIIEGALPEDVIVCNEGGMGSDNGSLSRISAFEGTSTNNWFRLINNVKLGDTPCSTLQVNDTLIAISVTGSNIIRFINIDGVACGATEAVPKSRHMCTDGQFLYVTSYAHQCGNQSFTKGFVAKIDLRTKSVTGTCEVGWEPDGIALYDGRLYIANTGGYSFSEGHEYESTIDVVKASDMTKITTIDTGKKNLYGELSQTGKYLLVNASGDYMTAGPATILLDCSTNIFTTFDFAGTYSDAYDGKFYVLGSEFSYETYAYVYSLHTIDAKTQSVTDGIYSQEVTDAITSMAAPYSMHISPETGYLYITDANDYQNAGTLYIFDNQGHAKRNVSVGISPSHIITLKR